MRSASGAALDALLAEADIVSLHLPLTDDTAALIDATAFARMKAGAILINTARGGLVDQACADRGTAQAAPGRRQGSTCSCTSRPIRADALFTLPNVVLTPHIAWLTTGTFDRSFVLAAENCRRLASGEALLHRVV